MSDKTKLEELSAELPEKERKELLDKITKRLAPQRNEEVMRVELNQEEKQRLVNEEMRHISGWGRFLLWLRHLLSGRSKRELFLYHKLGQLKRAIKQRTPGLTGFETRDLTPKFARQVYELYATAYPLKDFFRLFSQEQDFLDKSIAELVEAKYDESVKSLEDLLPLSEMEDIYAGSGYEEAVKKQLLRRFNEYVRKIPDRLFAQIEEGLKPFIYLKNLVLFPYADIFRHFSYFLPEQLEEANPHFNHGPAMLMLERLERFYFAIFLVLKLPKEWYCHPEILKSYALHSRELEDTDELDEQEISQEVIELTEALKTFIEHVRQFSTRIPLMDLIRYFRKDPYYRLVFNVPSFYIKAIYTAAIKRRVLEDFDHRSQKERGEPEDQEHLQDRQPAGALLLQRYAEFRFPQAGTSLFHPYQVADASLQLPVQGLQGAYPGSGADSQRLHPGQQPHRAEQADAMRRQSGRAGSQDRALRPLPGAG
jgi:hypothetical protein